MRKAKTLSEAYLVVREFLWDGTGTEDKNSKSIFICLATQLAYKNKKISYSQMRKIKDHIKNLLDVYPTVNCFLQDKYGVTRKEDKQLIQEYRHAWLVHLSQEAKLPKKVKS